MERRDGFAAMATGWFFSGLLIRPGLEPDAGAMEGRTDGGARGSRRRQQMGVDRAGTAPVEATSWWDGAVRGRGNKKRTRVSSDAKRCVAAASCWPSSPPMARKG